MLLYHHYVSFLMLPALSRFKFMISINLLSDSSLTVHFLPVPNHARIMTQVSSNVTCLNGCLPFSVSSSSSGRHLNLFVRRQAQRVLLYELIILLFGITSRTLLKDLYVDNFFTSILSLSVRNQPIGQRRRRKGEMKKEEEGG